MAIPSIEWMQKHFYFKRNPLPSEAILSEGSNEPSENGTIFNPEVNPSEVKEFLRKFILQPTYSKAAGFGALWSMGMGEEARGFGKSSMGLYGSKKVCLDFGYSVLKECGLSDHEAANMPLIASFTRFDKYTVTSFNAVAFQHVRWLSESQRGMYKISPIERLRERIRMKLTEEGRNLKPGRSEEVDAIKHKVKKIRLAISGPKIGPLNEEFLSSLADPDINKTREYLESVSSWNRTRNGFTYLDTLLTFAMAAGIKKAILFVDQVEDFASPEVYRYKRLREVERFRDIVKETAPFNSIVYYILTMHPRALETIEDIWEAARLPSIDLPPPWRRGPSENITRVLVLRGIQSDEDAMKLFRSYLTHPEYRFEEAPCEELHPFTSEAIKEIREANNGRPGYMLRQARGILEIAAEKNIEVIDESFARAITGRVPREKIAPPEERRELPSVLK